MSTNRKRYKTWYLLNRNSYITECRRSGFKCKERLATAFGLAEETIDRWEKNGWPDYAFEILIDVLQISRTRAMNLVIGNGAN